MASFLKYTTATGRVKLIASSEQSTLRELENLRAQGLTPIQAAVYFLTHNRAMTTLDIAAKTGLPLLQVLRVNRDAIRHVTITKEAAGVGLTN